MEDVIALIVYLGLPVIFLIGGYAIGKTVENRHFRDLERREEIYKRIVRMTTKRIPSNWHANDPILVQGQAVIGSDYFKTFASQIRNLFGGRVRSLETLMERARREAMLRMLEEAREHGANAVINIREETSTIGRGYGRQGLASAEIFVYGTALKVS